MPNVPSSFPRLRAGLFILQLTATLHPRPINASEIDSSPSPRINRRIDGDAIGGLPPALTRIIVASRNRLPQVSRRKLRTSARRCQLLRFLPGPLA